MLLAALLSLAGCTCTPDPLITPQSTGEPWDTTYLISADPGVVTDADLRAHTTKLTKHYWKYNQVEGVIWPGWRSKASLEFPDHYGTGGDGAIFTGFALATYSFEYGTVGGVHARNRAMNTLRGLYWLTHVAGPGVICRSVWPLAQKEKWNYPDRWSRRINDGFVHEAPEMFAPWGPNFPAAAYYTRGTKDQLTGLLTGLTVAWIAMKDVIGVRPLIAKIMENLRQHLVKHNWKIRDENGKNDTNADSVSRLIRVQFDALYRHTATLTQPADVVAGLEAEYIKNFRVRSVENVPNIANNYSQYYAHNLRISRGFSIWLLETDAARKKQVVEFILKDVWRYTRRHQNAWLAAIVAAVDPGNVEAKGVLRASLASLSLKPLRGWGSPYAGQKHAPKLTAVLQGCDRNWVLPPHLRKPTNYFTWTKRPWDVGQAQDKEGRLEETGLDFLAPYWVGRAFNGLN